MKPALSCFAALLFWLADSAAASTLELQAPEGARPSARLLQFNRWISDARPAGACEGSFDRPVPKALQPYIVSVRADCVDQGITLLLRTRGLRWLGQPVDEVLWATQQSDALLRYRVHGAEALLLKRWTALLGDHKPESEADHVHLLIRHHGAQQDRLDCSASPAGACHFSTWWH